MVSLNPYRYIIDTCAILSQKDDEPHRRKVYPSKWKKIDELVRCQEIVTCSEIALEVKDASIQEWMRQCQMRILPLDDEIQENVKQVLRVNSELVDFKTGKSSGDPFLIATAMKYDLTVITEEKTGSPKKIPFCCQKIGIDCIDINMLCEREGWQF